MSNIKNLIILRYLVDINNGYVKLVSQLRNTKPKVTSMNKATKLKRLSIVDEVATKYNHTNTNMSCLATYSKDVIEYASKLVREAYNSGYVFSSSMYDPIGMGTSSVIRNAYYQIITK